MGVEVHQANGAHAGEAFANPVETQIRYLVPQSHQLVEYTYRPDNGDPQTNGKYELKTVQIGDLKALAESEGLSVDKQGFTILENRWASHFEKRTTRMGL